MSILKREQLRNNILVIGELTEKKVVRSNVGTNDESISLTLTVKTSEHESHTINFFSYKYNMNENKQRLTSNNVSKMYLGYDTVANEYNAYLTTNLPSLLTYLFILKLPVISTNSAVSPVNLGCSSLFITLVVKYALY